MQPTIGRVVLYTLTEDDANAINRRRAGRATRERADVTTYGNRAEAGQIFPATVVRVWPPESAPLCNLQVNLDGADGAWVTSRAEGDKPGTWSWPPLATGGVLGRGVVLVGETGPAALGFEG